MRGRIIHPYFSSGCVMVVARISQREPDEFNSNVHMYNAVTSTSATFNIYDVSCRHGYILWGMILRDAVRDKKLEISISGEGLCRVFLDICLYLYVFTPLIFSLHSHNVCNYKYNNCYRTKRVNKKKKIH